ncbi:MAG: sugar ABC transporter substrate-binding protein [Anaerolineae bacterium]|nr:sugar ABC transporter substrate-binding protein [Anaerolineae bacterium]
MHRKYLVVLLIVVLAIASSSVARAQDIQLSYMMWGSPEELQVWQTIVDEFQAANPGIKVDVDVSDWGAYWDKLRTLFAGSTPPDVFAMDAPLYPDWQSRGALLNLQPYLDKSPDLLADVYPVTLETYKRDDGYYGLPRDFQTIVLFYNKDLFDAAGVAYPTDDWTMDDLRTAAKALTKDNDGDGFTDQWGFSTDLYDMELFWSGALWGYGGEVISADRTKTLLGDGTARDAWHFISDLVTVDKSVPTPEQIAQFGDPFGAGVAAMTTYGHWVVPEYANLPFKWDVAAFPAGPAGRATSINSAGFVVAAGSKNPDAAWKFLEYAIGPSGQTRLTELGFAIPILKSVAESPIYLEQTSAPINHKVFLDAVGYAHPKPAFKGYEEWAAVVGDTLTRAWNGEIGIDEALDEIVPNADSVLANNQ